MRLEIWVISQSRPCFNYITNLIARNNLNMNIF